jgi:hypothetical protein
MIPSCHRPWLVVHLLSCAVLRHADLRPLSELHLVAPIFIQLLPDDLQSSEPISTWLRANV